MDNVIEIKKKSFMLVFSEMIDRIQFDTIKVFYIIVTSFTSRGV